MLNLNKTNAKIAYKKIYEIAQRGQCTLIEINPTFAISRELYDQ